MDSKRDAYIQKLKAKIDEWNADLDKLAAKADQADGQRKIKYQQQIEELREKRRDFEKKLENLKNASESAWEDMKEGMEKSWQTWKESFSRAKTEFKKGYEEGKEK
ncbi:MAG: hypothetical protein R6X11_03445 [Desulfonatronovibrio sp.]